MNGFLSGHFSQMRHPFESIYTRGEKYRALKNKLQPASYNSSSDDDAGIVSF